MHGNLSSAIIESQRRALEEHPVYAAIEDLSDLACFMEHHVYSVWDFMSLVKYLQGVVAPAAHPWLPARDASVRRFINELVLEEESDEAPAGDMEPRFSSHFEIYCAAMREIGADPAGVEALVERVRHDDIDRVLAHAVIPEPARRFTRTTFDFIASGKPHVAAAALALGREHIIPDMFRAILARTGVSERQAPSFHYYLNRHIHLDEGMHAPLSLRLLNHLCGGDAEKIAAATAAARQAVDARIGFWDGVLEAISARRMAAAV